MTKAEYNGWFNYETWLVKLWMDNEQGSQSHYAELAENCYNNADADKTFTKDERAALDLAEILKDQHEETMIEDILKPIKLEASVWSDLLGAALSEVNWHEIAVSLIEDAKQVITAQ